MTPALAAEGCCLRENEHFSAASEVAPGCCALLGTFVSPNLLQKKIAIAMLVRSSGRVRTKPHHLPVARCIVFGPVRRRISIRISGPSEVRPVGLHQVGKLVVFRPEGR